MQHIQKSISMTSYNSLNQVLLQDFSDFQCVFQMAILYISQSDEYDMILAQI